MNKKLVTKVHFTLLAILLLNVLMGITMQVKLNAFFIFAIKMVVYASALFLLLASIRPWKSIALYYSLYVVIPFTIVIGWLAEGIFGALLATVYFVLLAPPESVGDYKGYELRRPFSGFFDSCCSYDIYQTHGFLLERKVAQHKFEISPEQIKHFKVSDDELSALLSVYDPHEKRDSTLVIRLMK